MYVLFFMIIIIDCEVEEEREEEEDNLFFRILFSIISFETDKKKDINNFFSI